ncbi:MAG: hypothetical protein EAZ53_14970 [Bacteroidetes bacterium]|nr:MAG: hypothetical protein EAZ53_14970 [Bacteroidota bacterium]
MKKVIFITIISIGFSFGQKVLVNETEEKIDEIRRIGVSTNLELDEDNIKDAWEKKLKEWGSYKYKNKIYTIEKAFLPTVSTVPMRLISKVETTRQGVKVWFTLDDGSQYLSSQATPKPFAEAKKILHDFGFEQYIADINEQIKDAEKVLSNSVREQEKMIDKGQDIRNSIVENRNEKIKFEKKIKEGEQMYLQLKSDSLANIANQAITTENVEKMKRSVEVVRSKISKVE